MPHTFINHDLPTQGIIFYQTSDDRFFWTHITHQGKWREIVNGVSVDVFPGAQTLALHDAAETYWATRVTSTLISHTIDFLHQIPSESLMITGHHFARPAWAAYRAVDNVIYACDMRYNTWWRVVSSGGAVLITDRLLLRRLNNGCNAYWRDREGDVRDAAIMVLG